MRVWNREAFAARAAHSGVRSGTIRLAVTAISLSVLALFALLNGQLPWLGNFEWLAGAHPERGYAWLAPLGNRSLDEDGHALEANLLDWAPGNPASAAARLCWWAGPAFAQRPDSVCSPYWHQLGPPHQPHDTIRNQGSGFSVWHGAVYFAMPADTDPPPPERHLALWVPWTMGAFLIAVGAAVGVAWAVWPYFGVYARHHSKLLLAAAGLIAGGAAA
ncbi:MAG: hypothetical protein WCC64_05820, partial [Aliidongia sp.]